MSIVKAILYWVVSCTWGAVMTFVGAVTSLVLIILGYRPKKFHYNIYFEIGERWGGLNLGAFFFVSKQSNERVKRHESGHGIQNLIFGVFFPFLIGLPSAIRYWYRDLVVRLGLKNISNLPDYDAVWFEKQATKLGDKYYLE